MVRISDNFSLICKTTETGEEICACDFRINIYGCQRSEFYVLYGKVFAVICILEVIMSGGLLIYLSKVKKQSFFLPASDERGRFRPKPLHSYHLIVFFYMAPLGFHFIALVNEWYSNHMIAEFVNASPAALSGAVAAFYTISIVYSTPNVRFSEDYETVNRRKGLNIRFVDASGIMLFLMPIVFFYPIALLLGHFADMNDIDTANAFFKVLYLAITAWEFVFLSLLFYFWHKLMSVIKGYIKVLEQRHISSGFTDSSHIQNIRSSTKNITIPVMAIVCGLFVQAIIFIVMSMTFRSEAVAFNYLFSLSYYWVLFIAFPVLGLFVEGYFVYSTIKNLITKSPSSNKPYSSPSPSLPSQSNQSNQSNNDNEV